MTEQQPAIEDLSIDRAALARRRDRLMTALAAAGYAPLLPEGTFYLFARWPAGDPAAHWDRLADRDVFVVPGSILGAPEHLRISLTASDAKVDKAVEALGEIGAAPLAA